MLRSDAKRSAAYPAAPTRGAAVTVAAAALAVPATAAVAVAPVAVPPGLSCDTGKHAIDDHTGYALCRNNGSATQTFLVCGWSPDVDGEHVTLGPGEPGQSTAHCAGPGSGIGEIQYGRSTPRSGRPVVGAGLQEHAWSETGTDPRAACLSGTSRLVTLQ